MGERAEALERLLTVAGMTSTGSASSFRVVDLPETLRARARTIFLELGGIADRFDRLTGPGAWDLVLEDGPIVELDEEQHFTRYRLRTLAHLGGLPWVEPYTAFCVDREGRCTARGGWWTNDSAERVFGRSGPPGVFSPPGPARWRQRAFNDALKDLHPGVTLSRVSIYDQVEGRTLDSILKRVDLAWAERVRDLVLARAARPSRE